MLKRTQIILALVVATFLVGGILLADTAADRRVKNEVTPLEQRLISAQKQKVQLVTDLNAVSGDKQAQEIELQNKEQQIRDLQKEVEKAKQEAQVAKQQAAARARARATTKVQVAAKPKTTVVRVSPISVQPVAVEIPKPVDPNGPPFGCYDSTGTPPSNEGLGKCLAKAVKGWEGAEWECLRQLWDH